MASGCDRGLGLSNNPIPIAVGASIRSSVGDRCTPQRGWNVNLCTRDSVTEFVSEEVDGPFAIERGPADTDRSIVRVRAMDAGRGTLRVTVVDQHRRRQTLVRELEARHADEVLPSVQCPSLHAAESPGAMPSMALAFGSELIVSFSMRAQGQTLIGEDFVPLEAVNLQPVSDAGIGGQRTYRAGDVPAMAEVHTTIGPRRTLTFAVRSPADLDAVGAVTVPAEVSAGGPALLIAHGLVEGRRFCTLPEGTWTATTEAPDICQFSRSTRTPIPTLTNETGTFTVHAHSGGTCPIRVELQPQGLSGRVELSVR